MTSKMEVVDNASPTSSVSQETEFYEVERIVDERVSFMEAKIEYLIKWKGYDEPKDLTWEDGESVKQTAGGTVEDWEKEKKKLIKKFSPARLKQRANVQRNLRFLKSNPPENSASTSGAVVVKMSQALPEAMGIPPPPKKSKGHVSDSESQQISEDDLIEVLSLGQRSLRSSTSTLFLEPLAPADTQSFSMEMEEGHSQQATDGDPILKEDYLDSILGKMMENINNIKKWNIRQSQDQRSQEAMKDQEIETLKKAVVDVKEHNVRLVSNMTQLDLMMTCRKHPVESLEKKNKKLSEDLKAAEMSLQELKDKVEELEKNSEKPGTDDIIEKAAAMFSIVLGYTVKNNQNAVRRLMPQVTERIRSMIKAEIL